MLRILLHVVVSPSVTLVLIQDCLDLQLLDSPVWFCLPLAPPTAIMALISLEDLEGLDDEQLDDDITDNPEPMDGDDRLLSHWQAVASTHQVSVPPGEGPEQLVR